MSSLKDTALFHAESTFLGPAVMESFDVICRRASGSEVLRAVPAQIRALFRVHNKVLVQGIPTTTAQMAHRTSINTFAFLNAIDVFGRGDGMLSFGNEIFLQW